MNLPIKILHKKGKAEYYLALILQNEKATSVIFEKEENAIKYVSHDEEEFSNTIEDAPTEEFLDLLDKVITSAETSLPESVETHKTIFGLKEIWIEDNKIKKEYLDKLKKACDKLSLEPIGFLSFTESIVNLLQKEEGAPITAVICDIGKKYITVSLIKAGRILETKSSEIHQSASYTVDTLLKHFQSPEVMPSRIILFDSDEEDLTQEFIGHQWSKSLPFLHLPQVSTLPKDTGVKAMLLGASTQMGTQLLYHSQNFEFRGEEKEEKLEPQASEEITNIENPIEKPQTPEEPKEPEEEPKETIDYVDQDNALEYFGFVEGKDIAEIPPPTESKEAENVPENIVKENIEEVPQEIKFKEEKREGVAVNATLVTAKIKDFLQKLPLTVKKINLGKLSAVFSKGGGNKKFIIAGILVLIIIVLILYVYFFATKAVVTILVSPKTAEKTTPVTFSQSGQTDLTNGIISAQTVSVTEEGTVTLPATGNKNVGTPAKGTVTVFNSGFDSVTLPSGTTITSPNNLNFTLDNGVTVASASGDIFSGTTPGTANVTVTASDIGQEYNMPSDTKFTVGSMTTVAAKNDNAFSGGTQKKVTVVSKDDLNKLLAALPKQLEQKAGSDIKTKVPAGKSLLPSFVSETVSNKTFSKKLNDQASQVTLQGTVDFEGLAYNYSDISDLAQNIFNSQDMELNKSSLNINAKNIQVAPSGDVTSDLDIKVSLLPKIDTVSLAKQIAGNSTLKAKNILLNFPQVESVNIALKPGIPFLPQNIPGNPNNITISVTSN